MVFGLFQSKPVIAQYQELFSSTFASTTAGMKLRVDVDGTFLSYDVLLSDKIGVAEKKLLGVCVVLQSRLGTYLRVMSDCFCIARFFSSFHLDFIY